MSIRMRWLLLTVGLFVATSSHGWAQQAAPEEPGVAAAAESGKPRQGVIIPEQHLAPGSPSAADEEAAPAAIPAPIVYLCDRSGRLATFDLNTKTVRIIGNIGVVLTDIGFHPNGTLYGVTFNQFYRVNPTTARATRVGRGFGSTGGINALTFNKAGQVFSTPQGFAASFNRSGIFLISPANGAISLGFTVTPSQLSAGDFAFNGSHLYLSTSNRLLVDFNFATGTYSSHPVSIVNLFGLVMAGPGQLYGFADTKAYKINPNTGASTLYADFTNSGLSQIYGAASPKFF